MAETVLISPMFSVARAKAASAVNGFQKPSRTGADVTGGLPVGEEHGIEQAAFGALCEPLIITDLSELLQR